MNIKAIVHTAEEGGFWAEVPAIPGCASQGDTMDELMLNLHEAIEGVVRKSLREKQATGYRVGIITEDDKYGEDSA